LSRKLRRPWGKRHARGWVIKTSALIEELKGADVVEFGGVKVGTSTLSRLLRLLPCEECLIRANGRLEMETIARVSRRVNDHTKVIFTKPRHDYHYMAIDDGAWVPRFSAKQIVIKPRKY